MQTKRIQKNSDTLLKAVMNLFPNMQQCKFKTVRGSEFKGLLTDDGITVDRLRETLTWDVFIQSFIFLRQNPSGARIGNGQTYIMGSPHLTFDNCIEGFVARNVYAIEDGIILKRRATYIAGILIKAGICTYEKKKLILTSVYL